MEADRAPYLLACETHFYNAMYPFIYAVYNFKLFFTNTRPFNPFYSVSDWPTPTVQYMPRQSPACASIKKLGAENRRSENLFLFCLKRRKRSCEQQMSMQKRIQISRGILAPERMFNQRLRANVFLSTFHKRNVEYIFMYTFVHLAHICHITCSVCVI